MAAGQDLYYQVFDDRARIFSSALGCRRAGRPPSPAALPCRLRPHSIRPTRTSSTLQPVLGPARFRKGGTYYILVDGFYSRRAGQAFSLKTLAAPLQIQSFTDRAGDNPRAAPASTWSVPDSRHRPRARLVDASHVSYSPVSVSVLGTSQLFAAFDLTSIPPRHLLRSGRTGCRYGDGSYRL